MESVEKMARMKAQKIMEYRDLGLELRAARDLYDVEDVFSDDVQSLIDRRSSGFDSRVALNVDVLVPLAHKLRRLRDLERARDAFAVSKSIARRERR
ncbi:MAG: hypothetical protein PHR30_18430 [Gallionellaceae bacterium]|nr:hypothetical protein [Gallionellaceae bacterium]